MWLAHHGIKGQKWGVHNGPPYPIGSINKKHLIERSKYYTPTINRPHSDYNLNKWGNNKDTNILWVTGIAGSGKSTVANDIAKKNNADLINIDLYTFKTSNGFVKGMSKSFNNYIDKKVPNWKELQRNAYEVLTKNDRRNMKQAGLWFDTFESVLKDYGSEMYGKKKVVAEGVQILDETLFYNNKKALRDQPLIIMDTSIEDSILSRVARDNKSVEKLLEPERRKQLENWVRDQKLLKSTMSEIM